MSDLKSEYVSTPIINYRLQIAERLGANKNVILQKVGISPQFISDSKALISLEQERALWRAMVAETNREDIGVVCGLHFPIQSLGLIGYVMMNSATIGIAMRKLCRYQKVVGDSMGMRIEDNDDYFTIIIELWSDWYEELRYTMDTMLTACLSWSEKNTIASIRPIRIGINYRQPTNHKVYRDYFSPAPVEFGVDESYLVYKKSDMNVPLLTPNNDMFIFFEKQVKDIYNEFTAANTLTSKVKHCIIENIENDVAGIELIASKLAMSVRKLQKELKKEGSNYQSLYNNVRKELAINYIKKGVLNKSEIAFLLGFSELSVFSRNFKKWTGYAPSDFPI